jgi:hypothetical protein
MDVSRDEACYCMGGVGPHAYHGTPRYGIDYGPGIDDEPEDEGGDGWDIEREDYTTYNGTR